MKKTDNNLYKKHTLNDGYKDLSNENSLYEEFQKQQQLNDGNSVFHYSRAHRLESAPRNVKQNYDGTGLQPPKGIFEALVHTKSSRMMLFVMIGALAVSVFLSILSSNEHKQTIGTIPITLSAFNFEESIYVSLKCSPITNFNKMQKIDITVNGLDDLDNIIMSEEITGFYDGNETFFRTIFTDYDIISIIAVVVVNDESKEVKTTVTKQ